jgi:hypothetical protein
MKLNDTAAYPDHYAVVTLPRFLMDLVTRAAAVL